MHEGLDRPLELAHVLAPGEFGGLERVVQNLAVGHAQRGHRVHVLAVLDAGAPAPPFLEPLQAAGVDVVPLDLPRRAYLRERARVRALCRRLRPDVVHTHGYRADVVDSAVARNLGLPTVTTVHGFTGGDVKNRVYEHLQRALLHRFDVVVAVSRALVERLAACGIPTDRLHFLPNAWVADVEPLPRDLARGQLGIAHDRFHIGWVGRLAHEKGPDIWLEALAHLKDLPLACSVMGGGGEERRLVRQARRLGLADRIIWHGPVRDAARLFSSFDLFVLSSRTEGTPVVLFEAMAANVPIVATRVGGVPDVVTSAEALLVEPEDPRALAAAVRSVYQDAASAGGRARAARQRLSTHYGAHPWLAAYESIYLRISGRVTVPR